MPDRSLWALQDAAWRRSLWPHPCTRQHPDTASDSGTTCMVPTSKTFMCTQRLAAGCNWMKTERTQWGWGVGGWEVTTYSANIVLSIRFRMLISNAITTDDNFFLLMHCYSRNSRMAALSSEGPLGVYSCSLDLWKPKLDFFKYIWLENRQLRPAWKS